MPRVTKKQLTEALGVALEDQIWMSGSPSFGPEGDAHEYWKVVRERLYENLRLHRVVKESISGSAR